MTVEFMRQMHDFSSRNPEKRNDYLNEKFISYYFRNILAALRQNYIDDLRDVISP
ncbi:hypothetical protein AtDm6_3353 [Acetobacter tropicalis]|uniref:Uncharacterized protein n=2 Tax=Acetobacter tropicalis TaxID=104102 RepID=A0A095AW33_9PROT|nr:hypothetical protein AtDm6_3353 [Acetobacter tropicalis]